MGYVRTMYIYFLIYFRKLERGGGQKSSNLFLCGERGGGDLLFLLFKKFRALMQRQKRF